MERKKVGGRFVAGSEGDVRPKKPAVGAPRPRYCRSFTRKRVAEALPEIVEKFLDEAKKGSIPHAKALTALSGLDRGEVVPAVVTRRGKSFADRLIEEIRLGRAAEEARAGKAAPEGAGTVE